MLADQHFQAGAYSIKWDASGLSAGAYFCRIQTRNVIQTIKLDLIR
jgi:hypothetical protein